MYYTFDDNSKPEKSGNDLMDEITSKFQTDRNWFNSPFSSSSSKSTDFDPFRDNSRSRRSSDVKSRLDDLAKRYPEFADHLNRPEWNREPSSARMNRNAPTVNTNPTDWEHAYTIPVKIERSNDHHGVSSPCTVDSNNYDTASEPRLDRHGLRNTVDIGEQIHKNSAKQEGDPQKRAFSAPPANGERPIPKSTAAAASELPPKRYTSKIEITPVDPFQPADPRNLSGTENEDGNGGSKSPSANKKSNVRHIPIFVEGRKDPVLPKSSATNAEAHDQQQPLKRKLDSTAASKKPDDSATPPPSKPVPKKLNPLNQIEEIQKEVDELAKKIESFNGTSRSDKAYLYLDEMLTRNLIKLDVIEVNGNEDIRAARKNAIKTIQVCIAALENKVPNKEAPSTDVEMEGDNESIKDATAETDNSKQEEQSSPMDTTNNGAGGDVVTDQALRKNGEIEKKSDAADSMKMDSQQVPAATVADNTNNQIIDQQHNLQQSNVEEKNSTSFVGQDSGQSIMDNSGNSTSAGQKTEPNIGSKDDSSQNRSDHHHVESRRGRKLNNSRGGRAASNKKPTASRQQSKQSKQVEASTASELDVPEEFKRDLLDSEDFIPDPAFETTTIPESFDIHSGAEGITPLIDVTYSQLQADTSNFREHVPECAYAYYVAVLVWHKMLKVHALNGNQTTADEQNFIQQIDNLTPVLKPPRLVSLYVSGIGNTHMPNSDIIWRFSIYNHTYANGLTCGNGWFGRADYTNQHLYKSYPNLEVYKLRIQKDMDPGDFDHWQLPAEVADLTSLHPNANLLGYKPKIRLTDAQVSFLQSTGVTETSFSDDNSTFPLNCALLRAVQEQIDSCDSVPKCTVSDGDTGTLGQISFFTITGSTNVELTGEAVQNSVIKLHSPITYGSSAFLYRIFRTKGEVTDGTMCVPWCINDFDNNRVPEAYNANCNLLRENEKPILNIKMFITVPYLLNERLNDILHRSARDSFSKTQIALQQ